MFELRDVDAGYGAAAVLHNVTLAVPPSSIVALLGANGAGKTTLLRVASGLLRPTAGAVYVDGRDMTGCHPHDLTAAGVCHVPEGRGIFPTLSVRENVVLQSPRRGEAEAVERATEVFPALGRRLAQTAGTLSGGEQQMLALARAYVTEPRFVLLDEVSMGLAPKIVDEIFEFLGRLAARGASLLLVEQYITRALGVAHYVYLLNRGVISFAGEPAELNEDDVFTRYIGTELAGSLAVGEQSQETGGAS